MRRRGNRSFFCIIALIAIIISLTQPAFARSRRGGNSSGDLAVAFVGGAAMPAGAVVGAGIAGGGFSGATYQASLASSATSLAAGNIASAGMTWGGVNPHTASLVSAGVSGLAGGLSSVNSANLAGSTATTQISKSMISSLVSSEATYQFSEAGVPLSGALGSITGSFAGGFTQGTLSSEGGFGQSLADGFSQGAAYGIGKNGSSIGYAVASDLAYKTIVNTVDERSLARPYAGQIAGLGGRVAGHFAGTTRSGTPNMLSEDFHKRGSWLRDWEKKDGNWNTTVTLKDGTQQPMSKSIADFQKYQNKEYRVTGQPEDYAGQKHDFIQVDNIWRENRSYGEYFIGDGNPMKSTLHNISAPTPQLQIRALDLSNIYK